MLSRNLEKAKDAYSNRDVSAAKVAHAVGPSFGEQHKQDQGKYIKSIIYGGLDGIITTFAVVAGVAGASLNSSIVLIMGFANLIADGMSMAIGDYLSTKAEIEYNQAERDRERWEVENYPEGEKQEMIELYVEKGLEHEEADTIVSILEKHPEAWVDIMMKEELGIVEEEESPLMNGLVTFISFVVFGVVPLCAYVVAKAFGTDESLTFPIACVLAAVTLFALGALKVRVTEKNWFFSGLEMTVVGGVAAAAAYGIGYLLAGIAG